MVNVGKYTIHGSSGLLKLLSFAKFRFLKFSAYSPFSKENDHQVSSRNLGNLDGSEPATRIIRSLTKRVYKVGP